MAKPTVPRLGAVPSGVAVGFCNLSVGMRTFEHAEVPKMLIFIYISTQSRFTFFSGDEYRKVG
ncbi:hypothetical protein B5C06_02200 [Staphylococcus delphini]|nr:hypothetical protein B5C06_02200 [Staphylococcus delphini]